MKSHLDPDTSQVIDLLRDAVNISGLSQAAFARTLGTSPPRFSTYLSGRTRPSAQFLVRARRIGLALGAANDHGLMSAPSTAAAMHARLRAREMTWVWRMLLQGRDHLQEILERGDQVLIDSWEAAPGSAGSPEWGALLAALADRSFEAAGAAVPVWTQHARIDSPWSPEHPFLSAERVRELSPGWLIQRNIYIPERDLVTA